jgi:hypothetical protein
MLYKVLAAAVLVSSTDALNIGTGMDRRAAIAKAFSVAPAVVALPAFAELKKAGDAAIYERADKGSLSVARAIERAKTGDLVDGSSATCAELDAILEVDREAIQFEDDKLGGRFLEERGNVGKVQDVKATLKEQVVSLKKIRADKNCPSAEKNLKQATDFEVYKRADKGELNAARVIDRARSGKLVDGSGATCSELEKLVAIDKKALAFEKDKLEFMSKSDPAEIKAVEKAAKAIEAQIAKLEKKQKDKKC